MKDFVAFLLFVIVAVFIIAVMSDKPPTNKYEKVICANLTCAYEIEGK